MNDEFIIRNGTNSDTFAIVDLVSKTLSEFGLEFSPNTSESDLIDIEKTYTESGGAFMVIETPNNKLIGTVALLKIDAATCKLRKMYVDQAYRGKGLGEQLLEMAIKKAEDLQFTSIVLETVHSMKAAINLYKKHGFIASCGIAISSPRCDMVMVKELFSNRDLK
jgi:ribosomal protein S18 acetylase RimI-like enzyme